MAEKKKPSVITSPTFACCFTLFSLACTAVFVLSDHRPSAWSSSLSLLFPPSSSTSSPRFTPPPKLSNGTVESSKGKTVNSTNPPATSSPDIQAIGNRSGSLLNSRYVESGSEKGSLVNVSDSSATSSPDNQVRAPNGYVSSNDSADLLNKGKFESGSGKGKSVNVSDSAATSSPDNRVRDSDGPVSGNYSDSEKGEMVNSSLLDNQDKVSNGSTIGFLSNSSVSLLDKKDGHFRESHDRSRTGGSVSSSSSINNSLRNGTFESGSEKGKMVNATLNGDATVLSNKTITDNQSGVLNNSTLSKENGNLGGSNRSSNQMNQTANNESVKGKTVNQRKEDLWEKMIGCDFFDGNWVKDDSYPLYKPGSCPHIDEPFDCFRNGRPDNDYEKFRWQPKGCNIPRLNGRDLLEMIRGKRLVYVGDSLNRNMWESMVCTLRNAVKDKRRVFEASGKRDFRTEHSYSFIFLDYNCSVEFFRSTFLVREWDVADTNGLKQETLRLDMVARSFDRFKDADILVFNTGHWWTHEKTAKGKGYYQEGSHVYDELNVIEAFRRAMTTWGRWIDNNINPKKTLVIYRGYSASHFSGGQWNSGGQCDSETVPIKNETYLKGYPSKMIMFEKVMRGMRTPVLLLNVTKMTDFRKDAHPSVYRSQHLTEEERKSPLRFQDCSHWCLPGIPETWNELLYAQIFTKYKLQKEKQQRSRQLVTIDN